jgi:hypothetical protein
MPMRNFSTLIYFINNSQENLGRVEAEMSERKREVLVEKTEAQPSDQSVKRILDFARSYDVLESKSTGYVEMNLN